MLYVEDLKMMICANCKDFANGVCTVYRVPVRENQRELQCNRHDEFLGLFEDPEANERD